MCELLAHVLGERDLSRAGDLFSIDDAEIEKDLSVSLRKIQEIASGRGYVQNVNDQSVVEICMTRFTSAIREMGSIEKHAPALVSLLDSCLKHNLSPVSRDEDSPHAKIASDILSCIFLNYSKKSVIELAMPVAVRFLTKGNKELCRSLSSYLSLGAYDNARLLAVYAQLILDSIIIYRNRLLIRILPIIYAENREPVHYQIASLLYLLQDCETTEKCSVLQLCCLIAAHKPGVLEPCIPQMCIHLTSGVTASMVLQAFADIAALNPGVFLNHVPKLKQTAVTLPSTLAPVSVILGYVGKISKFQCRECVGFIVSELASVTDAGTQTALLREVKNAGSAHPHVLLEFMSSIARISPISSSAARSLIQQLAELASRGDATPERRTVGSQTEGIVTVVTSATGNHNLSSRDQLVTATLPYSSDQTHRNASTSTQELCAPGIYYATGSRERVARARRGYRTDVGSYHRGVLPHTLDSSGFAGGEQMLGGYHIKETAERSEWWGDSRHRLAAIRTATLNDSSASFMTGTQSSDSLANTLDNRHQMMYLRMQGSLPGARSITPLSGVSGAASGGGSLVRNNAFLSQRQVIVVGDVIQQFCEKLSERLKMYMDGLHVKIPIPVTARITHGDSGRRKCTIDFVCQSQSGQHCLYHDNLFSFTTKHPKTWIHFMFLMLQCRSVRPAGCTDPAIVSLSATWDSLSRESDISFVKLVTSSFPSAKDQTAVLHELSRMQYLDIFEFLATEDRWSCFVCARPNKVLDLLRPDGLPNLEGQLKGKRGRLKVLKPWKTRTFTLSGTTMSYSSKDSRSIPLGNIRAVRTPSNKRFGNVLLSNNNQQPNEFEVFTDDSKSYVLRAADARLAKQWVQCLQVAIARTRHRRDSGDLSEATSSTRSSREMPRWASLGRPVKSNVTTADTLDSVRRQTYSRECDV